MMDKRKDCDPGSEPDPLQSLQASNVGIRIFSVTPLTAFSRLIVKENSRSEPRFDSLCPGKRVATKNIAEDISKNIIESICS